MASVKCLRNHLKIIKLKLSKNDKQVNGATQISVEDVSANLRLE